MVNLNLKLKIFQQNVRAVRWDFSRKNMGKVEGTLIGLAP